MPPACSSRRAEPGAGGRRFTLLAALTVLPAAVFVQHALGDRVQANWPAVTYPAAAIAAAALPWGGAWLGATALGGAITAAVYLQGVLAPLKLPAPLDPTLLRVGGWSGLAEAVAVQAARSGAAFVAAPNYGVAAELAWRLKRPMAVVGVDPRWALFDLPDARPTIAGRAGLLLAQADEMPNPADWGTLLPMTEFDRTRGGVAAGRYRLYLVIGRAGPEPAALLPRPQ